ncbi:hypothetical protein AURDEDRAFT_116213 [Auricularia subglabra TFB-10046 SS5]|nr:hypothetical protein AURDEDRAFT_116213 [Auricularia subglabra TFB-10046 SS5]
MLDRPCSNIIKMLETLCRQAGFASYTRLLALTWRDTEVNLTLFAERLKQALQNTPDLRQLCVPQLPAIYHWSFHEHRCRGLTHLELSAYLTLNPRGVALIDANRTTLQSLRLHPEWPGASEDSTAYHAQYTKLQMDLPRMKKLTHLGIGCLPMAAEIIRTNAKTVTSLLLEDADERWHRDLDRRAIYQDCFEILWANQRVTHIAFRHPHGLGPLARGMDGRPTVESVASVTFHMCPWSDCDCKTIRVTAKDSGHMTTFTTLFPVAAAFRFFCPGQKGSMVSSAIWPICGALAGSPGRKGVQPTVRPIAYEGGARGVSLFWHKWNADAPPAQHPYAFVLPSAGSAL